MLKSYRYILNILMLLLALPTCLMAQDAEESDIFKVRFNVGYDRGDKEKGVEYNMVQYAKFKTETTARKYVGDIRKAVSDVSGMGGTSLPDPEAWHKMVVAKKMKFIPSKSSGQFNILNAQEGQAIYITTYSPSVEFSEDDMRDTVIVFKKGVKEYDIVFRVAMDKTTHRIDNVNIDKKVRDTVSIKPAAPIDDGKNLYIPIDLRFPAGYLTENSRMVVQPMVVNCQTEDTVAYVPGLDFEGEQYHTLQDKSMLFDFMKNDNLNYAYVDKPMFEDVPFEYHGMITFPKPSPRLTYKVPFRVLIADANQVWFNKEYSTSSCTAKSIFKFIDLGVASAELDPEEFRVEAEDNLITGNKDLRLKFIVGKDVLMEDSTNTAEINSLLDILRSKGALLSNVKIQGTASPEGGYESNVKLAAARARYSRNYIKSSTQGMDYNIGEMPAKVYTWEDVAKRLEEQMYYNEAADIRARMGNNGYGGDAAIAQLPYYQNTILPILESMRLMRVTYSYQSMKKMTAAECLVEYNKRKEALLRNDPTVDDFSNGDYFNLLTTVKDSVELGTITKLAYRNMQRDPGYTREKYSMYISNRMAMLNNSMGKPDADVLKPFIQRRSQITQKDFSGKVQMNRVELLINQIITYMQLEQRDTALSYLDFYFAKDNMTKWNISDEVKDKVERMRKFVTFKENFIPYTAKTLSKEKEEEFLEALDFVYSCSKDNKAIIYTEAHDELHTDLAEAEELVDSMDDNSPRKWYLKGVIYAKQEKEKSAGKQPKSYFPEYMAYFDHSFEEDKNMKRLYFKEGNVDDELRKKYHYKKALIPRYKDKFAENVVLKSQAETQVVENEEDEFSGEDEEDEIAQNNEEKTNDTDNANDAVADSDKQQL